MYPYPTKNNRGPAVLSALFWDPFDVAHAIKALIRDGYSEDEIDAIGVLSGHAPDLTDSLFSMGIDWDKAIFYNDCLADGAMLLIVRTGRRARLVLNMLRRHGGIVPSAKNSAKTVTGALPAVEKEVTS